jgi:hypothetical protein
MGCRKETLRDEDATGGNRHASEKLSARGFKEFGHGVLFVLPGINRVMKEERRGGCPLRSYVPRSSCLPFAGEGVTKSSGEGRFVVFALHNILRATVVEAEYLVVQIQAGGIYLQTVRQSIRTLHVNLEVRVQVVVASGTFGAQRLSAGL